jgi:outer membrane immunogenic protein
MKKMIPALALSIALFPGAAFAQDGDRSPLAGPHIGVDGVYDSLEANQPNGTREATRRGFGARAHVGYDAVLGDVVLVGVEAGIGTGGRTVTQPSLAGGRYSVNPGLTYDVTARLGVAPGGYRWLRTEQSIAGQTTGNFRRDVTERGFTYGGGVEYALTDSISLRAEYDRTRFSRDLRQSKVAVGATIRF